MHTIMIGLDLAKNVFQVHGSDGSGQVFRRRLRRAEVERYFASLPAAAVVGMEACAGAHYWGRTLQRLGHEVRMMPPAYVKPYVKRNKNDARDAEAVWEAMQRPTMRFVAVKSEANQAIAVLHRTRELLVRQRTMAANALRAGFAEFGIVAAQGIKGLRTLIAQLAAEDAIPQPACAALLLLGQRWQELDANIRELEAGILRAARQDERARRLMEVPGVGPIVASAVLAKVADPHVFRSARGLAAWLGFTPRQSSSGGKQRSGAISKQGDRTLRSLLIIGASAYLRQARARGIKNPWLAKLLARRPYKVVAVALAHKTARIIWALLVKGERYRAPAPAAA
jgi:transposase